MVKLEGTAHQVYSLANGSKKKDVRQTVAVDSDGMNCLAVYSTEDFGIIDMSDRYESCISTVHFGSAKFAYGLSDSRVICDKYASS